MTIHLVIILIIIILFSGFFVYVTIHNKFQDYIIKINEVESKIDDSLREKFDTLLNLNNLLKEKIGTKKALVDDLSNLKDENISSFDMDRKLVEAMNKVIFIKEKYTELENDEDISKLICNIDDTDESLRACKKYYNETITEYNKLIRKIPYNIIGKILKYKEKPFFDGKNMYDEDINDFKI